MLKIFFSEIRSLYGTDASFFGFAHTLTLAHSLLTVAIKKLILPQHSYLNRRATSRANLELGNHLKI